MVPHNSATLFPLFWHKHLCRHSEPWDQSLAHLDSAYSHLLCSWDWLPQRCLWWAKRYQYFTPPNSVSYSDFGIFPISLTLFLPFLSLFTFYCPHLTLTHQPSVIFLMTYYTQTSSSRAVLLEKEMRRDYIRNVRKINISLNYSSMTVKSKQ